MPTLPSTVTFSAPEPPPVMVAKMPSRRPFTRLPAAVETVTPSVVLVVAKMPLPVALIVPEPVTFTVTLPSSPEVFDALMPSASAPWVVIDWVPESVTRTSPSPLVVAKMP